MCVIMYKPCILFALCICLLNLLQCWDIHSRADIQMIFLCLKPVCNVCPPFWLSQAWGACTFCSMIFSQCTRAPPVQTLLLLPLTVCESLKRWHPGSWFKWFKFLPELGTEFLLVSTLPPALTTAICTSLACAEGCKNQGHLLLYWGSTSALPFFFFPPLFDLVCFFVAFFETWRFCWALALQGWDPAGAREHAFLRRPAVAHRMQRDFNC